MYIKLSLLALHAAPARTLQAQELLIYGLTENMVFGSNAYLLNGKQYTQKHRTFSKFSFSSIHKVALLMLRKMLFSETCLRGPLVISFLWCCTSLQHCKHSKRLTSLVTFHIQYSMGSFGYGLVSTTQGTSLSPHILNGESTTVAEGPASTSKWTIINFTDCFKLCLLLARHQWLHITPSFPS